MAAANGTIKIPAYLFEPLNGVGWQAILLAMRQQVGNQRGENSLEFFACRRHLGKKVIFSMALAGDL